MTRSHLLIGAACVAASILGAAIGTATSRPRNSVPCAPHYQGTPITWGEYASGLDAALRNGKIDKGQFMTLCLIHKDGRAQVLSVYGLGVLMQPVGNMTMIP